MPSFYHPIRQHNFSISTVGTLDFEDSDDDDDIRPDVKSEYMLVPSPELESDLPSPRSSVIPFIYRRPPEFSTWVEHLTPEYEEDDDFLHEPELDPRLLDASGTIFTRRGFENLGGLALTLLAMVCIMVLPAALEFSRAPFSYRTDKLHAPGWVSGPGVYPSGGR